MAGLKALITCLLLLTLTTATRGDDERGVSPSEEGAYETDRPGEIDNPFTLPVGGLEIVNYVVGANAPAREDAFGGEGSAVFMDTTLRVGVATRVEAIISVDSFLAENSLQGSRPESGLGDTTLGAKWNILKDAEGDYGIGLAPLVRLPLNQSIGGTARPELGIIVPFEFDLEGGWDLQGSTGIARSPDGPSDWSTQWENQVSIERTLTNALIAYLELQVESGEGPPAWSTEFGVNWRLGKRAVADIGASIGIGSNRARTSYAGLGWRF
jgi:hypothetical protein